MITLQERRDALQDELDRVRRRAMETPPSRSLRAQIALLDELIEQEAREFPAVEPEPELLEALITLRVGGEKSLSGQDSLAVWAFISHLSDAVLAAEAPWRHDRCPRRMIEEMSAQIRGLEAAWLRVNGRPMHA